MSLTDIDHPVIEGYLNNALMHAAAKNDWAEGFWIGRAVSHADQNAVDHDWLVEAFTTRGLDAAVIAVPKDDAADPRDN